MLTRRSDARWVAGVGSLDGPCIALSRLCLMYFFAASVMMGNASETNHGILDRLVVFAWIGEFALKGASVRAIEEEGGRTSVLKTRKPVAELAMSDISGAVRTYSFQSTKR